MTKEEAANFLGVSTKSIERYANMGKLHAKDEKVKGRTRPIVIFDDDEVKKLKDEMEISANKVIDITAPEKPFLVNNKDLNLAILERLTTLIEKQQEKEKLKTDNKDNISIGDKLILTRKEASSLLSMSEDKLTEFLKNGQLKGFLNTLGKGWRIKRQDLDQFVKNFK